MATEIRAAHAAAGNPEKVGVDLDCDEIEETKPRPQPIEPLSPMEWCEAILSTVVELEEF